MQQIVPTVDICVLEECDILSIYDHLRLPSVFMRVLGCKMNLADQVDVCTYNTEEFAVLDIAD